MYIHRHNIGKMLLKNELNNLPFFWLKDWQLFWFHFYCDREPVRVVELYKTLENNIVWKPNRQNWPNLAKQVHHEILVDFDSLYDTLSEIDEYRWSTGGQNP